MQHLIAVSSALLIAWSTFPSAAMAKIMCGERGDG